MPAFSRKISLTEGIRARGQSDSDAVTEHNAQAEQQKPEIHSSLMKPLDQVVSKEFASSAMPYILFPYVCPPTPNVDSARRYTIPLHFHMARHAHLHTASPTSRTSLARYCFAS